MSRIQSRTVTSMCVINTFYSFVPQRVWIVMDWRTGRGHIWSLFKNGQPPRCTLVWTSAPNSTNTLTVSSYAARVPRSGRVGGAGDGIGEARSGCPYQSASWRLPFQGTLNPTLNHKPREELVSFQLLPGGVGFPGIGFVFELKWLVFEIPIVNIPWVMSFIRV
jgi:hypothetical protein